MRVRKSIPEGYKTEAKPLTNRARSNATSMPSGRGFYGGFAELAPYCGVHKIGGFESQIVPPEEDLPALQLDDNDDYGFPSSQDSDISSISTDSVPTTLPFHPIKDFYPNNNKRAFTEDNDEFRTSSDPLWPAEDHHNCITLQTRGYLVGNTDGPNLLADPFIRPIAQPRTRRKQWPCTTTTTTTATAMSTTVSSTPISNQLQQQPPQESDMKDFPEDFEDAEFFKPEAWDRGGRETETEPDLGMDREMEMELNGAE